MNKGDLIKKIVEETSFATSEVKTILDARDNAVKEALASGDKVAIVGYGTYSITERAARAGRNPKTGEAIQIAAKKVIKFKAGKELSKSVNV